jgi:Uma2 family endonuclease
MTIASEHKQLIPGSTGWSIDDLDDPEVRWQFDEGRFEIVYGVLAKMSPPMFDHGLALGRLIRVLHRYFDAKGIDADVAPAPTVVIDRRRVLLADLVMLTGDDLARQLANRPQADKDADRLGNLVVPPTLIVEAASPGHESHDYEFKREQYAQFRVPNYWILNHSDRSLTCLRLEGPAYIEDARGKHHDEIRPTAFPDLVIALKDIFP